MKVNDKILTNLNSLKKEIQGIKKYNKKIVLCRGHFNVIHPGHLRFLEFARSKGDYLVIALQGREQLEPKVRDVFFDERERARSVASLEGVDRVFIYNRISFTDIIKTVRPNTYVLGEEFLKKTSEIKGELELVKKLHGKVVFSSGDIRYATPDFLDYDSSDEAIKRRNLFISALKKQKISMSRIENLFNTFKNLHILVLGDTIVDQYIACDALGMSAEAPVLVVREIEKKEFVGGAAVVSRHVKALGSKCSFISVMGNDEPGMLVKKVLEKDGIDAHLFKDNQRPTTFKIRYIVGSQKILRVTRLNDRHINEQLESKIISTFTKIAPKVDGIIVSDFVYGVITPKIIEHLSYVSRRYNLKLFGDVQSSSQIGNVCKFKNFDLLTPTEREARIALDDTYNGLEMLGANLLHKTNSKNVVITLADKGIISFKRIEGRDFLKNQHFPALSANPIDVLGAGDSLLVGFALGLCAGANLMEASVIASGVASIEVNKVGNTPVKSDEFKNWMKELKQI